MANRSGYLFVHPEFCSDNINHGFTYIISFFEPFTEKSHARSCIEVGSLIDIIALHELCQEMLDLKKGIEDGTVTGGSKISKESEHFVFEMWIDSESWYSMERKEDGADGQKKGIKKKTACTSGIDVSVVTEKVKISIGRIGFSKGLKSAVLLAHDLDVIMALINDKPALDIIKMRPQTVAETYTESELVELRKTTDIEIDWESVRAQEAREIEYVEDLKRQAQAIDGQEV